MELNAQLKKNNDPVDDTLLDEDIMEEGTNILPS
jgi:hypothetical protein